MFTVRSVPHYFGILIAVVSSSSVLIFNIMMFVKYIFLRFEVFMAMKIRIVFWHVTPSSVAVSYYTFLCIYWLLFCPRFGRLFYIIA